MEHFDIIMLLMLAIICEGNAELKIHVPKNFSAGEIISGSCTTSVKDFDHVPEYQVFINVESNDDKCTVNQSNKVKTVGKHYKKDFTINCSTNGSHHIECHTSGMNHDYKKINFQVTEKPSPKITSKPRNVTIAVGLPITFRCYVEGDPNHYWVGWMTKNTIIQPGEEYSVSTSPSFKSVNGTTHYLTVHKVKEAGKYDCQVYSLVGDVVDFITHEVIISNDATKLSLKSSPSVGKTH